MTTNPAATALPIGNGGAHDKMRPNQPETGFRVRIEAGSERPDTDTVTRLRLNLRDLLT